MTEQKRKVGWLLDALAKDPDPPKKGRKNRNLVFFLANKEEIERERWQLAGMPKRYGKPCMKQMRILVHMIRLCFIKTGTSMMKNNLSKKRIPLKKNLFLHLFIKRRI